MTERDPTTIYINLADGGRARNERDRVACDLIGLHDRAKYLKRRIADLRHWTLAKSSSAAYDATEHEKELAKVDRKTARLWKRFDALEAAAPPV